MRLDQRGLSACLHRAIEVHHRRLRVPRRVDLRVARALPSWTGFGDAGRALSDSSGCRVPWSGLGCSAIRDAVPRANGPVPRLRDELANGAIGLWRRIGELADADCLWLMRPTLTTSVSNGTEEVTTARNVRVRFKAPWSEAVCPFGELGAHRPRRRPLRFLQDGSLRVDRDEEPARDGRRSAAGAETSGRDRAQGPASPHGSGRAPGGATAVVGGCTGFIVKPSPIEIASQSTEGFCHCGAPRTRSDACPIVASTCA